MNVHILPVRARRIIGLVERSPTPTSVPKAVRHDPRWPQVESVLAALSASGRRAVRIVDAECGTGTLLLEALKQARRLGFTAIADLVAAVLDRMGCPPANSLDAVLGLDGAARRVAHGIAAARAA